MADTSAATVVELIARVSNRLRQFMATGMDAADLGGLTMHQARMLGFIEATQDRGVIARDIAEATGTRPASVSPVLAGLEQDGWIERRPDPADSRRKTLHVTPKGYDLVKNFEAGLWSGVEPQIEAALDAADRAALVAALTKLDRHLAEVSPTT
ncbi:MarR family transcriptional regulator [Actinotalea sp. M2MS4P-6]|uniref:MarR family winged helix-turn-helix transcriptional regulator n=1 Tax=Actinotalea sp. M2MS4P-6 TaxID=2983762 RepID=UPI0021E3EB6C|nr:MarR family transcriptional regulator [Actinotalea sp. M2MS4P-6]MCV2396202.1 MarR family transcriptional regulator [Actinotalea sp. M2MS4P-6]